MSRRSISGFSIFTAAVLAILSFPLLLGLLMLGVFANSAANGSPDLAMLFWGAALLSISAGGAWFAVREDRLHARAYEGQCLRCGYVLLAAQRRCPECGAPVTG